MSAPWESVREALEADLATLQDEEFLVLGEPMPESGPPRGLLRRRSAPPPSRYVQLRRDREWLYGECVGATLFGGDWEISEVQHQQLRAMGWLAPGDDDPAGVQPSYPNYWVLLPRAEPHRVAQLSVDTLALLAVNPLTLERRRARLS